MMRTVVDLHYPRKVDDGFGFHHINFPTGEKHIRIFGVTPEDRVLLSSRGSYVDLMKIGMAVDSLERQGVQEIGLYLPFIPYARQDRVADIGDPISIKVFANFLNTLKLDYVIVADPHSDVASSLIDRTRIIEQHRIAQAAVLDLEDEVGEVTLVAPDIGAAKKLQKLKTYLFQKYQLECDVIQCDKKRDPSTGKITGFRILDGDPDGKNCLMVDDICDGGGTFLGLAEVLEERGASSQHLYITHGIFSKGPGVLRGQFDSLYASDSIEQDEDIFTIPLEEFVYEQLVTGD